MEFIDLLSPGTEESIPDHSLYTEMKFTPTGHRLLNMLHATAAYLCHLTNSDGYIIYRYDEVNDELYMCPADVHDKDPLSGCICKWKIGRDKTIAIHVLKYMKPIVVDAVSSVDLNFPYLQDIASVAPKYILSLPLVNFNRRCFGVVEYYRNEGKQYNERDVNLCQFILNNCAEALMQNESATFFIKYNKIQLKLQHFMEKFAYGQHRDGSYRFLNEVVKMARSATRAMSSSVYFEKKNSMVEIQNADVDVQPKIYSLCFTEVITRSEMSSVFHTTIMNHELNGVLKVFNKFGVIKFLKFDEQILKSFSEMLRVWSIIEYMSGYLKKQESLNKNILGLINMQLQYPGDCDKQLVTLSPTDLDRINSWTYSLEPTVNDKQLASDLFVMFNIIKGQHPISDQPLKDFIVMVGQSHKRAKENNFAATVLCVQCLYKLFQDCMNIVSELEVFAMMIASLCRRIELVDSDTLNSAIFGRYNTHADKLIRFEIIKVLISDTQLISALSEEDQEKLLFMIKKYMIDTSLQTFKENTLKLTRLTKVQTITAATLGEVPELRELVLSVIPGVANTLGHFRTQDFQVNFPEFSLFQMLEKKKGNCIDTFVLVNSL